MRPPFAGEVARDERKKRKRPAFAAIVGAHRHQHIFDGDDQHQRPEDQAQHAEDMKGVDRQRVRPEEALLHGVKRRGSDVAIDDANRAERQLGERLLRVPSAGAPLPGCSLSDVSSSIPLMCGASV